MLFIGLTYMYMYQFNDKMIYIKVNRIMENIYFQNKTKTDDIHVSLSLIVSIYQGIHACTDFFFNLRKKKKYKHVLPYFAFARTDVVRIETLAISYIYE